MRSVWLSRRVCSAVSGEWSCGIEFFGFPLSLICTWSEAGRKNGWSQSSVDRGGPRVMAGRSPFAVGQDVVVGAAFVILEPFAEGIKLVDLGSFHVVQNEVHPGDADHGAVIIVAAKKAAEIVLFAFGPDWKDIVGCAIPFETEHVLAGMFGLPLQKGIEQEASGAAGGIPYPPGSRPRFISSRRVCSPLWTIFTNSSDRRLISLGFSTWDFHFSGYGSAPNRPQG